MECVIMAHASKVIIRKRSKYFVYVKRMWTKTSICFDELKSIKFSWKSFRRKGIFHRFNVQGLCRNTMINVEHLCRSWESCTRSYRGVERKLQRLWSINNVNSVNIFFLTAWGEREIEKDHLHLSLSTAFATHMSISAVPTHCLIVFRAENKKIREKRRKIAIASELFAQRFLPLSSDSRINTVNV